MRGKPSQKRCGSKAGPSGGALGCPRAPPPETRYTEASRRAQATGRRRRRRRRDLGADQRGVARDPHRGLPPPPPPPPPPQPPPSPEGPGNPGGQWSPCPWLGTIDILERAGTPRGPSVRHRASDRPRGRRLQVALRARTSREKARKSCGKARKSRGKARKSRGKARRGARPCAAVSGVATV